jgi:hypothetical protein
MAADMPLAVNVGGASAGASAGASVANGPVVVMNYANNSQEVTWALCFEHDHTITEPVYFDVDKIGTHAPHKAGKNLRVIYHEKFSAMERLAQTTNFNFAKVDIARVNIVSFQRSADHLEVVKAG